MIEKMFHSLTEQVAEVLKEGMLSGRWRETLPGRNRLAAELGVSHKTVETAMRQLMTSSAWQGLRKTDAVELVASNQGVVLGWRLTERRMK